MADKSITGVAHDISQETSRAVPEQGARQTASYLERELTRRPGSAGLVKVTAGMVSPVRGCVQTMKFCSESTLSSPTSDIDLLPTGWSRSRLLPMKPVDNAEAIDKRSPPTVPARGSSIKTTQVLAEKHRNKMAERTGLTSIQRVLVEMSYAGVDI